MSVPPPSINRTEVPGAMRRSGGEFADPLQIERSNDDGFQGAAVPHGREGGESAGTWSSRRTI